MLILASKPINPLSVLSLFRVNQLFYSVLLLPVVILFFLSAFFYPQEWQILDGGILSKGALGLLGEDSRLSKIVAICLVFSQGFYINSLIHQHQLSRTPNLYAGLFYVYLSCLSPYFLQLSPLMLGMTFILTALGQIWPVYRVPYAANKIFNAGFFVGIAGLFYFPLTVFTFLIIASLNVLRAFQLKEVIMALIGCFIPYFLAVVYYYWNFDIHSFLQLQFNSLSFGFSYHPAGYTPLSISVCYIFAALLLLGLLNYNGYLAKRVMQAQKKIQVLFWWLLVAPLALFLQSSVSIHHLLLLSAPLGILLSFSFGTLPNKYADALFIVMLFGLIIIHYLHIFL